LKLLYNNDRYEIRVLKDVSREEDKNTVMLSLDQSRGKATGRFQKAIIENTSLTDVKFACGDTVIVDITSLLELEIDGRQVTLISAPDIIAVFADEDVGEANE